jgi:GntR family transcriptional regulator/MocR family aminotransferase
MTAGAPPALIAPYPPGTLVMAGGVPDTRLLPADLFARALRRVLSARDARGALSYGDPRGDRRLRAAVADLVRETRGVPARPEDVLVVRGSQMALALAARAIVPPGGSIGVEALGYPSAWAAFASAGARLVPVPVDARGLDVDALAALTRRERIHAVYVTPHHQYPTTVTLAPGRRSALLDLARRERFAVIEDDYDHELHYEGRPVLPLASADIQGSVVYVGSLSKVLAPGLRLGYVVAAAPVVERLARERFVIDRQGDHGGERAAAELIEDGTLARHVRRMRRVYMARRDLLVDLLKNAFGDRVEVQPPAGGMALWVRVRLPPPKIVAWEKRAVEQGVAFVAGERLAFDGRPIPFARIGFAPLDETEVREAVARLARAFHCIAPEYSRSQGPSPDRPRRSNR